MEYSTEFPLKVPFLSTGTFYEIPQNFYGTFNGISIESPIALIGTFNGIPFRSLIAFY